MRELRSQRAISLRQMARALGVSPAYLSALETGKRGRPSWYLVQRTIAYFNVIWDDAEELAALARASHPKLVFDMSRLGPQARNLLHQLAETIGELDAETLTQLQQLLAEERGRRESHERKPQDDATV